MNSASVGLVLFVLTSSSCSSTEPNRPVRRINHEYDYLLAVRSRENRHDEFGLGLHHVDVPKARAALLEESRAEIRVRAVMAISEGLAEKGIPDYVAALDDPSADVVAEAAHELAAWGSAYMDRDRSATADAALRAHAAGLRAIATSAGSAELPRERAAGALVFIADRDSLTPFLRDKDLVGLGLEIASQLSLSTEEIGLLEAIVSAEPKNEAALRVLVEKSPTAGLPFLQAAIERGDADSGLADAVVDHKFTGAVPGILRALAQTPRDFSIKRWLDALRMLDAVCAARAIASILADPNFESSATEALRALSRHPDATEDQLRRWAMSQPDNVPPCK